MSSAAPAAPARSVAVTVIGVLTLIPFAAAQILYAVLAFVILIKKGGEFSRRRLGANDLLTCRPGDDE
jgi:hypothetical protein